MRTKSVINVVFLFLLCCIFSVPMSVVIILVLRTTLFWGSVGELLFLMSYGRLVRRFELTLYSFFYWTNVSGKRRSFSDMAVYCTATQTRGNKWSTREHVHSYCSGWAL